MRELPDLKVSLRNLSFNTTQLRESLLRFVSIELNDRRRDDPRPSLAPYLERCDSATGTPRVGVARVLQGS